MPKKPPLRDPKLVCDAIRKYGPEARALLKGEVKAPERLPAEIVRKLRIMAIRGVSLPKMEERTGIPMKKIWPAVSDIDITQEGKGSQWREAKEIIRRGGNAESASMQTGLPLVDAKRLEDKVISETYRLLREQVIPEEGPSLAEENRIIQLRQKGIRKKGISKRTGFSEEEIGQVLEKNRRQFPELHVAEGKNKAKKSIESMTPNEAMFGLLPNRVSLADASKVFQARYGSKKKTDIPRVAKELGMHERTVEKYFNRYGGAFPEYSAQLKARKNRK